MRDTGGLRGIYKGIVSVNIERLLIIAIRIAIRRAGGEGGADRFLRFGEHRALTATLACVEEVTAGVLEGIGRGSEGVK